MGMTPEGKVLAYLKRRVRELGGEYRRVQFTGRMHAPDALIWFTRLYDNEPRRDAFIETKKTGDAARAGQLREHKRMRKGGIQVFVADTTEKVDEVLAWLTRSQ